MATAPRLTEEIPTNQTRQLESDDFAPLYPADCDDVGDEPSWGSDPFEIVAHRETFGD